MTFTLHSRAYPGVAECFGLCNAGTHTINDENDTVFSLVPRLWRATRAAMYPAGRMARA